LTQAGTSGVRETGIAHPFHVGRKDFVIDVYSFRGQKMNAFRLDLVRGYALAENVLLDVVVAVDGLTQLCHVLKRKLPHNDHFSSCRWSQLLTSRKLLHIIDLYRTNRGTTEVDLEMAAFPYRPERKHRWHTFKRSSALTLNAPLTGPQLPNAPKTKFVLERRKKTPTDIPLSRRLRQHRSYPKAIVPKVCLKLPKVCLRLSND
jgi:hypothetical protein